MPKYSLPFRQIHLDFHTGPAIPDVGICFDAEAFGDTMARAHVNSVTLFAKCHHGHLYYNTTRPERHPGLAADVDLLAMQVAALHKRGIRAPVYISVQCDEYAANTHPEWVARNPDSSQVKWGGGVFHPGWQIMDMSSPYQEFLAEQTREVLDYFHPADGVFFDMCWDQPSTTKWAIDGMLSKGYDPESDTDRNRYAHDVSFAYMQRFYEMVKAANPDAGVFFNSRPFFNIAEEIQFQGQVEIEALPTGGWGYMYFPRNVRYARNFDKPYMGMTARFHKSWADFGGMKPYPALEYEVSQMIAHGARCSIGDQLHPRGELDSAVYDLIGKAYAHVEACEPWAEHAEAVTEIGVFQRPTGVTSTTQSTSRIDEGVTRMLTQLRFQFNFIDTDSDFSKYQLLILPDAMPVDTTLAARIKDFLQQGGAVLATGTSGLNADGTQVMLPELGIKAEGISPYQATYLRFNEEIAAGVPATDHIVYDKGIRVIAQQGAVVLAQVVEPYFNRTWQHFSSHFQTPNDKVSQYAAAVRNGQCAYINFPVFNAFAEHGNYPYRLLVQNIIQQLLPQPMLQVSGPSGLETSVMRQEGRTVVHLLYYPIERRAANLDLIEDIIPLHNLEVSLRLPAEPSCVYLAPDGQQLPFTWSDGQVTTTVPEMQGHAMVVFEDW